MTTTARHKHTFNQLGRCLDCGIWFDAPSCARCGGACPPRADGYCLVLGFPATNGGYDA